LFLLSHLFLHYRLNLPSRSFLKNHPHLKYLMFLHYLKLQKSRLSRSFL
jgi:hypothetical protein